MEVAGIKMAWRLHLPVGLSVLFAVAPAAATADRYVNSRQLVLSFEAANAAPVESVEVWVSTDDDSNWAPAEADLTVPGVARYQARQDGRYGFYVVLANSAGCSAEPPERGSQPHVTVVVDTAPPMLQIHQAEFVRGADGVTRLRASLSLIEENLGEAGLRVFYRTAADQPWRDGGPVSVADGHTTWPSPTDLDSEVDLRLVATDQAGNRAWEDIANLAIPSASPSAEPANQPHPSAGPHGRITVASVERAAVEPVEPVSPGQRSTVRTPSTQPSVASSSRLRELASRHMALGELSLATARLEDALAQSPHDADLLVDLGSVLYRAQRHEEARRRFQEAAASSPDHLGAIEGLALVAATQNRYAQARTHLKHLLRLRPESGHFWLRYGDMEHKLGNAAEAVRAWEQALRAGGVDDRVAEQAKARLKYFGPTTRPAGR
jgi:hypothetical protein